MRIILEREIITLKGGGLNNSVCLKFHYRIGVLGMKKKSEDYSQQNFGDNMRKRRLELNISQEELSFRAGLHRNYVSDVERGTRNVSIKAMEKIAKGLDTSLYKLLKPANKTD